MYSLKFNSIFLPLKFLLLFSGMDVVTTGASVSFLPPGGEAIWAQLCRNTKPIPVLRKINKRLNFKQLRMFK